MEIFITSMIITTLILLVIFNYFHPDVIENRKLLRFCSEEYAKHVKVAYSISWVTDDQIFNFLSNNNISAGVCRFLQNNSIYQTPYWIHRNCTKEKFWCNIPVTFSVFGDPLLKSNWKQLLTYRANILKDEYEHILVFGYCARFFKPL